MPVTDGSAPELSRQFCTQPMRLTHPNYQPSVLNHVAGEVKEDRNRVRTGTTSEFIAQARSHVCRGSACADKTIVLAVFFAARFCAQNLADYSLKQDHHRASF